MFKLDLRNCSKSNDEIIIANSYDKNSSILIVFMWKERITIFAKELIRLLEI